MAKKKYYVVWVGARPGIYNSWAECQAQIAGFPGAKYKSFTSKSEAERAYRQKPDAFLSSKKKSTPKTQRGIDRKALSVDAACSGNPGNMEYRGVWVSNGEELFRQGVFRQGTNNVGEFLALVHALAYFDKKQQYTTPIYSDSKIAIGWVHKGKAKTQLKKTAQNAILFDLIERAESWLAKHEIKNPILKWETKAWGEIPADFGRK